MNKLADLMEQNADQLAALEALDNGKTFATARSFDVTASTDTIRYYAGWCDKHMGRTIEVNESKLAYVRFEPIGVVVSRRRLRVSEKEADANLFNP